MVSNLFAKDSFVNTNIPYLFNANIIEYDMKEAGFSLTKELKLLSDKTIESLTHMSKEKRKIELGKIERANPKYKEEKKNAFIYGRELFFKKNNLEDNDVISIKKDAIFVKRTCDYTQFGEYIDFRPKHQYTSYIQFEKRKEFYYSPSEYAFKGISDKLLKMHEEYMINFMCNYCRMMETSDKKRVLSFLRRFIDKYKAKELNIGYYRRFDIKSNYDIIGQEDVIYMDYDEENIDDINILFNYQNIILKLVKIAV